jgi:hypothetical protein
LERGRKLAGTSWSGANSDLVGAWLRAHTKGSLCARDLQSAKEEQGRKVLQVSTKEKGALLGHISQGTYCKA